jgi:hypothetical protein
MFAFFWIRIRNSNANPMTGSGSTTLKKQPQLALPTKLAVFHIRGILTQTRILGSICGITDLDPAPNPYSSVAFKMLTKPAGLKTCGSASGTIGIKGSKTETYLLCFTLCGGARRQPADPRPPQPPPCCRTATPPPLPRASGRSPASALPGIRIQNLFIVSPCGAAPGGRAGGPAPATAASMLPYSHTSTSAPASGRSPATELPGIRIQNLLIVSPCGAAPGGRAGGPAPATAASMLPYSHTSTSAPRIRPKPSNRTAWHERKCQQQGDFLKIFLCPLVTILYYSHSCVKMPTLFPLSRNSILFSSYTFILLIYLYFWRLKKKNFYSTFRLYFRQKIKQAIRKITFMLSPTSSAVFLRLNSARIRRRRLAKAVAAAGSCSCCKLSTRPSWPSSNNSWSLGSSCGSECFTTAPVRQNRRDETQSTYFLLEMKQSQCICPLSWSVHCNFTGDGKCNERGWACIPQPHQPRLILPS